MDQTPWILPLNDGTFVTIPADKVKDINTKISRREPITTKERTILYADLAGGPRKYEPTQAAPSLEEQALIAFNEPVMVEGEVKVVWVKQQVSSSRWNKYYANFSTYFKLGNNYDSVIFAYRLPVHNVDKSVEKCTPAEIEELEKRLASV